MIKRTALIMSLVSGICFSLIAHAAPLYDSSMIDLGVENQYGVETTTVTATPPFNKLTGNMVNAVCGICQVSHTGYNPGNPITTNGSAIALNAQEGKPFTGSITIPLTIQVNVPGKGNETVTAAPTITFTGIGGFMMNAAGNTPITSKTDPKLVCQVNTEAETTQIGVVIPLVLVQCAENV